MTKGAVIPKLAKLAKWEDANWIPENTPSWSRIKVLMVIYLALKDFESLEEDNLKEPTKEEVEEPNQCKEDITLEKRAQRIQQKEMTMRPRSM